MVKWKKLFKSNNLHYTVKQIYLTTEIVAKCYIWQLEKIDLVKLHNQITHNYSSLYHFLGLTFNSCLLYLKPICVCGQRVSAICHQSNQSSGLQRGHTYKGAGLVKLLYFALWNSICGPCVIAECPECAELSSWSLLQQPSWKVLWLVSKGSCP